MELEEQVSVGPRAQFDQTGIERPQLYLDVVGIPQGDQGTTIFLLNSRVGHAECVEMRRPLLQRWAISHFERKVIQPDDTLVESMTRTLLVDHEADGQPTRMLHAPDPEPRS